MSATHWVDQAVAALVAVYLMQAIKRSTWVPWLHAETAQRNRWTAWGLAAVSAIAIDLTRDPVWRWVRPLWWGS